MFLSAISIFFEHKSSLLINELYQNEIFSNRDVWLCWIADQVKVLDAKYSKQEANALAQEMKFIVEFSPVSHGQMAPPLQSGTPSPQYLQLKY